MNFEFYESHIKTLCDLQALAEKHNCKLAFGTAGNSFDDEIDESFLEEYLNCPKDIAKEICEKCYFEEVRGDYSKSFFELYDKTKEKYHKLTYFTLSVGFKVEADGDLSTEAEDWLDNSSTGDEYPDDNEYFMIVDTTREQVFGFDGIKKEGWIYRPGIMLAVFTQLVCDYLNEERIKRVY